MKEKTWKEVQNEEKRGKRRYLERLAETRDANKEIVDFLEHNDEQTKNDENSRYQS